jgi:hypothetical protein
MSSNSIRISADLFAAAAADGAVLSRSAAQQLEHWAKLGRAFEAGASSELVRTVLAAAVQSHGRPASVQFADEQQLWAFKRELQARDLASGGHGSQHTMSWFTREEASSARVLGEPF